MKLLRILTTLKPAGTVASALLLLSVSTATLSAFDDKEKEKPAPARAHAAPAQNREAPARARQAPEAAPSRSAPAPSYTPAPRQERSPNVAPPSRQDSSPSYNPPSRSTPAPSYNPPSQQGRNPGYNPPSRQESSPSYTPSNRPSQTPTYNQPAQQTTSPSYTPAPAGRTQDTPGGFRRVDPGPAGNAPAHGNMPNQSGQPGMHNQAPPAGVQNQQSGNGGVVRLPAGQTTRNNDGSAIRVAQDGRVIHMDPRGRVTNVEVKGGGQIHYAPNGRPDRVVTRSGAVVINRPTGVRQIVVDHPGNVQIVTNARGQGYIQRPFSAHGHEYYQRTYYVHDRPYVNVYRPYRYGGISFQVYTPVRYYRPAFYGWAYSPWNRPVYYSWGWGAAPWYGYYGPYFAPYPVYRSPIFWLTDFLFASTLEYGYDQRMADAYAAGARDASYQQQAMSPDVKQMVADEVQRQLAQERAEGQNPGNVMQDTGDSGPGIFNDGASHALVVYNPIQANDGGMGCALTEGDVIGFEGNLTPGVEFASVRVLASKGQDCASGSTVGVSLQDILEMQNHLRETIDRGLGQLQTNAGSGGLPALPAQAMGAPINSPIASDVPQADPNGAAELSRQAQEATQGEQAVLNEAPPLDNGGFNSAQTPTITLGMTMSQVQSLLGPPKRLVDLGAKRMYIYDDMKVVFMDGRVSDVQ